MKKSIKFLPIFVVAVVLMFVVAYSVVRYNMSYDYMLKYKDILDLGGDPMRAGISTIF